MQIEITLSEELLDLYREMAASLQAAASDIDRIEKLLKEAVELNMRTRKLLYENAKLLRHTVSAPGALHIAREGDDEMSDDAESE